MAKEVFELDPEMVLLKEKLSKIPRENWVALFSVFSETDLEILRKGRRIANSKFIREEYLKSDGLNSVDYMYREINFWRYYLNDSNKADSLLKLMQIVAESGSAVNLKNRVLICFII